ncbi:MAG: ABC transporter permease [Aerococcus sp.]|nr:ABC transporter permease [Aerococcus sp.]
MDPRNFRYGKLGIFNSLSLIMRNEVLALWQNKGLILSMSVQPFLYVVFLVNGFGALAGTITYHGVAIPYTSYALCGVLSTVMTAQMSQATYRSTIDKQYGLLALKITNGVRPLEYIIGMSTFPVIGYFLEAILLWILGALTGALAGIPFFGLAIIAGVPVLFFWTTIGIMVSSLLKNYQQRDLFLQLVFAPLAFTSPAFYLLDRAPTYIQVIAAINPMTYQLSFIRGVAMGDFNLTFFLITVILAVLCLGLAMILLNRMPLTLQER